MKGERVGEGVGVGVGVDEVCCCFLMRYSPGVLL